MAAARGDRGKMELAWQLQVSLTTIYRWESGESMPALERQEDVARAYGVPWAVLFDPSDDDATVPA